MLPTVNKAERARAFGKPLLRSLQKGSACCCSVRTTISLVGAGRLRVVAMGGVAWERWVKCAVVLAPCARTGYRRLTPDCRGMAPTPTWKTGLRGGCAQGPSSFDSRFAGSLASRKATGRVERGGRLASFSTSSSMWVWTSFDRNSALGVNRRQPSQAGRSHAVATVLPSLPVGADEGMGVKQRG